MRVINENGTALGISYTVSLIPRPVGCECSQFIGALNYAIVYSEGAFRLNYGTGYVGDAIKVCPYCGKKLRMEI